MCEPPIPPELRTLVEAHASQAKATIFNWETRISHDMGIIGDIFVEFLEDVNRHFGTDFTNIRWTDYSPSEGELLNIWPGKKRVLAKCRPMTVKQLYAAITNGAWIEKTQQKERYIFNTMLIDLASTFGPIGIGLLLVILWSATHRSL